MSHQNRWFSIKNSGAPNVPAEILLFDEIGAWGTTAKNFAEELKTIPPETPITVGINSAGGSVFDGMAIYNLLSARKDKVTCRVDGLAASIASVIAMAGRTVQMPANALMMIHDPTGAVIGDADDMKAMAQVLDKIRDQIAGVYSQKTGKTPDDCRALMADETWMTADEAKALGFCDSISSPVVANNFSNTLQRFPKAIAKGIVVAVNNSVGTAPAKSKYMTKLLNALAGAKLIPTAKLDDEEAATMFAESMSGIQTQIEELKAVKAELATAQGQVVQLRTAKAEAAIAAAVQAGRIKDDAKLRSAWVTSFLKDEQAATELLASVPEPKTAHGHAPVAMTANADAKTDAEILAEFKAMKPGRERDAFLKAHGTALYRAGK